MLAVIADEDYARLSSSGPEEMTGATGGSTEAASSATGTLTLAPAGDPFDRIVLELERTFAGHLLGGSVDRLVRGAG